MSGRNRKMETKELKIQVPEGYEIDKENSIFECIRFKPIKKTANYDEVVKELFKNMTVYYTLHSECIARNKYSDTPASTWNNCTSKKQIGKLIAINKLMNVAKCLNGDWKPNWESVIETKWYIAIGKYWKINIYYVYCVNGSSVYFKTKELAQQALEILGEDTIRLALSTDW